MIFIVLLCIGTDSSLLRTCERLSHQSPHPSPNPFNCSGPLSLPVPPHMLSVSLAIWTTCYQMGVERIWGPSCKASLHLLSCASQSGSKPTPSLTPNPLACACIDLTSTLVLPVFLYSGTLEKAWLHPFLIFILFFFFHSHIHVPFLHITHIFFLPYFQFPHIWGSLRLLIVKQWIIIFVIRNLKILF